MGRSLHAGGLAGDDLPGATDSALPQTGEPKILLNRGAVEHTPEVNKDVKKAACSSIRMRRSDGSMRWNLRAPE